MGWHVPCVLCGHYLDVVQLKQWVEGWSLSQSDKRALYKQLWETYEHVNLQ